MNLSAKAPVKPPAPADSLFLAFQQALAGRYSLDRELGRGGMGVVYLAREVHLDRWVAIKLLPPEYAAQPLLRERFVREAQLAARLSHPHIVPIHAVDAADNFVYFVMAYVAGETLAQRVQARGPVSASDGARVLREVAWALGHAHTQGLVHRDVKPDNILLEAETGRALVADFGIAAATGASHGDGVSGTPEFMSPEQAMGRDVDARSDIYSLGATAFYALCGRLPFEGATPTEVLARQVTEVAPSLSASATAVPRKLAQLVDACLSKSPADRPQSAQHLADQLSVAIEQRRELPAPLRAFVKRNGRMDGGGTLLSLVGSLVAGVALSSVTGPITGVLAIAGGVAVSALAFGILSAKRLLDLGFTQADLAPAFRAERENSREERVMHHGRVRTLIEKSLRVVAGVLGATSTALAGLAMFTPDPTGFAVIAALAATGFLVAIVPALAYVALMQLRRDIDIEFWNAAWTGRSGTWAFAIAKRWRGASPIAPAMTHRATELSLGMASESLFESLPKASRESLGDVPALVQRLQHEAQQLRARANALQDALGGTMTASQRDDHSVLCAERDAVHARLRETVSALESIRLGMLRLHAGSLTVDAFTTQLGLAADVSVQVDRLIAAQDEVDVLLRFPRSIELTPV